MSEISNMLLKFGINCFSHEQSTFTSRIPQTFINKKYSENCINAKLQNFTPSFTLCDIFIYFLIVCFYVVIYCKSIFISLLDTLEIIKK